MNKLTAIKIGLWTAVFFVLVGGLAFLRIDISKKTNEIKKMRNEIKFGQNLNEGISLSNSDLNKIRPFIGEIENYLPSGDELINFPRELKEMANQNKVSATINFSGDDKSSAESLSFLSLSVNAEGEFGDLISFMKGIENGNYSVKLESLDFRRAESGYKISSIGKVFTFKK